MKKSKIRDGIRLQKFIADCGITSRRKAEELILEGRVEVNGDIIRELGTRVLPSKDQVLVDGNLIELDQVQKHYILLHKPKGYVTTLFDPEGRPTVIDLIKIISDRVYPVGRLDYYSEGLLILTNDGELANWIMHPSKSIHKVYEVKVFGKVNQKILRSLREGIHDYDGVLKPKSVRVIKELKQKTWLEFRLTEGKNREIRRLCESCGLTIDKLKRISIEGISIEGIAPGKFKFLTRKQVLSRLGLNEKGERIRPHIDMKSSKKTIKLKGRKEDIYGDEKTLATDEKFHRYRRDQYQTTVKIQKEAFENQKIQKEEHEKAEADKKFEKRREAKIERRKKKKAYGSKRKKRV